MCLSNRIKFEHRTYYFIANSTEDCDQWIAQLRSRIKVGMCVHVLERQMIHIDLFHHVIYFEYFRKTCAPTWRIVYYDT